MRKTSKKSMLLYILLIVALLFIPVVIKNRYMITLVDEILVFIIAILGLNYITGLTGESNMGMAGIFSLGAYTSAILTLRTGVSPFVGILAAIPMGIFIGNLLGRPSLRVKGIYLALSTMMFGEIVRLLANNMVGLTNGSTGLRNIPHFSVFGYTLTNEGQVFYLYFAICLFAIFLSNIIFSGRWGRAFKAIRDNEDGVPSCGIDIAKTKITAFTLCAVFGSVAGAMFAHLMGYISPDMFDFDFMVKFFMMLMLGGSGTVSGSVFGAVIVVIVPEALRFLGDYYWLVFSTGMLLFIIFVPNGIVSLKDRVIGKIVKRNNSCGGQ